MPALQILQADYQLAPVFAGIEAGKGGGRDDHDRPDSPSNGSGKVPELVH